MKHTEFLLLSDLFYTSYKVFREIGYAEELGSGIRNLYKYSKLYSGSDPKLAEDDVFTTTILLSELAEQVDHPSTTQVPPKTKEQKAYWHFTGKPEQLKR